MTEIEEKILFTIILILWIISTVLSLLTENMLYMTIIVFGILGFLLYSIWGY